MTARPILSVLNDYIEAVNAKTIADERHARTLATALYVPEGVYIIGNLVVRVHKDFSHKDIDIYVAKETQTNGWRF